MNFRYPKQRNYLILVADNYYSLSLDVNSIFEEILLLKEREMIINWLHSLNKENAIRLIKKPKITLKCKLVPLIDK
ncbi:hypothetical protein [Rummeliibacillus stabekisii]|uniref:Uncharacterized protein n=1 Tax=Rummeliibacillus stabekisii TaxID=241244 RepID=A0A143HFT6_9BACL|nr:hypothetical protein [Rummeliibacillus stabekisii]AMX00361.1 hypothetical protein ATY39_13635 [Rummeliibacillus stabekisii]